jgi:fatty-acyl-CoA synthase
MPAGSLGKMLVGSVLATAAIRFPDNEAFYCSATGRRFTYREANARCNRLAHALLDLGFAKGDVVAFLCTNRVEVAEIYFALAKSGIVGIPLNYRLAPSEIVDLMRSMGAKGMLCEARFEPVATQVLAALPQVRQCIAIGDASAAWGLDYEALLVRSPAGEPEAAIDEADAYYFNLTSGTTGLPKSYVLTQFNNSSIGAFMDSFDMTRRDVVMTVFPMFGRVGFAWILGGAMFGVKNVLMNFDPGECLRLVESERVTIVNLVPTMAAMLLAADSLAARDISSLRAIVFAGSMLPAPIREQAIARICPALYEYYGMQETGALVVSTPEDRALRADSVGRPVMFAEVKVVGPDDKPVATGEIGEIAGRSPSTVTGYFQNPAKSAETFKGGWLHTGDLGRIDADGYLFICGRLKDMIISGGQNVHSAEVEAAILAHPGVADCAVIGLPDDVWGESVTAVVVPNNKVGIDAETLRQFCRERLAGFKTPKQIVVQDAPLPRTATGKVQKFLLVEKYAGAARN